MWKESMLLALTSVTVVFCSDYTRASPYSAFPGDIQIIRLQHFGNLSANDERTALAARWRRVMALFLLGVPSPYL